MSVVLVVEPDAAQAALLRKMQRRLGAELVLVETTDDAIESIERRVPDLILLSALLSPRDEDRLMKHLRSLDDAAHLHTLTIPQLRTGASRQTADKTSKKGFSFGKKRGKAAAPTGCDPDVFAEEIAAQLARAGEVRHQPRVVRATRVAHTAPAESVAEAAAVAESVFTDTTDAFEAAPGAPRTLAWPDEPAPPVEHFTPRDLVASSKVFAQPEAFTGQSEVFAQPEVVAQAPTFAQPEVVRHPDVFTSAQVFAEPEPVIEPAIHEPTVSQILAASWNKLRHVVPSPPVPPPPVAPEPADDESELQRIARELGVSLDSGIVDVQDGASAERMAAEVALVQAETEAKLAAELERVRAESEERRLAELAQLQADADVMREAAIAEARAAAEEETRRALAGEVARVRSEAEGTVAQAVNRVKIEAEQTLNQEIGRARKDAEALRADLARAQQEATVTARALEQEVARVRGQAETHLKAELERIGKEAERARVSDQSHAKKTAEQIREAAAREARTIAEEAARQTLEAEIARVRSQADTILETELARVRAEAQERQASELLELRVEMDAIRKASAEQARAAAEQSRAAAAAEQARVAAAAEQARAIAAAEQARAVAAEQARAVAAEQARAVAAEQVRAVAAEQARAAAEQVRAVAAERARAVAAEQVRAVAAEQARAAAEQVRAVAAERARAVAAEQARAVAAEQARAAAEHARAAAARRPADVLSFPGLESSPAERFSAPQIVNTVHAEDVDAEEIAELEEPVAVASGGRRRDYYSLWRKDTARASEEQQVKGEPSESVDYVKWLKWGLPIAASLLVVGIAGIDSIARLATSGPVEPGPTKVVREVRERRAVAPPAVEMKLGTLKVESTPPGAQITLDGESRGETPQTITGLKPGVHEVVLHSAAGAISRHITIKAGQTAIASEAIFAGWLAIFAPIKLDVSLNGVPRTPTDDGRFMIAPGTYRVDMTSSRFNFRHTETLIVKPGEVTPYTVSLPTGLLKISVPDGTEVSVDGHTIGKAPFSEVLPLVVGTHEVTVTHPDLGSRRTTVDVKFEQTTEATLSFEP